MLLAFVLIVSLAGLTFIAGQKVARQEEQIIVARVLAEVYHADVSAKAAVVRVLGSLRRDYTEAFDAVEGEVERETAAIKTALASDVNDVKAL